MSAELAAYLRGWIAYFGKCETPSVLQGLEQMAPASTRVGDLEGVEAGFGALRQATSTGDGQELAAQTAGSAREPLRLANSPAPGIALSNAYFVSLSVPRLTVVPIA